MCHGPTMLRTYGTKEGFTLNYQRLSEALFVIGLSPESLLKLLQETTNNGEATCENLRADAIDALTRICEGKQPRFKFELTQSDDGLPTCKITIPAETKISY